MKTLTSCRKLPKEQTCKRKVNRTIELFPGPIKLSEARTIGLDIYSCFCFSHDIAFQSSFTEGFTFHEQTLKKGRTLNSYFGKFYRNYFTFFLTSHSGFTYRLVN